MTQHPKEVPEILNQKQFNGIQESMMLFIGKITLSIIFKVMLLQEESLNLLLNTNNCSTLPHKYF